MKRCSSCEVEKPLDAFCKDAKRKDGLQTICRECRKLLIADWRARNPDKVKAAAQARIDDGRSALHTANYRRRHPEKIEARQKARYAADPKGIKKVLADWAKANPELKRASKDAWRRANPESVRATRNKNRAMRLAAPGSHSAQQIADLRKKQKGCCAICRVKVGDKYHVDHVIPLAGGGTNDILNIQILCGPCNHRKSDKDPVRFMQERGYLL